jgi:hypothetical protein
MPHKRLTEEGVRRLKPTPGKQPAIFDTIVPRLLVRINYGGSKSWRVLYYVAGKPRSYALGYFPQMSVKQARDAARKFDENPRAIIDKTEVGSFKEVAEEFIKRHVEANELRSREDIKRSLGYVLRKWADRPFLEIRRRDVTVLLDQVSDQHSPGVADSVLALLRKLFNWYAARSDDYVSPVVPGMRRSKPTSRFAARRSHFQDVPIA